MCWALRGVRTDTAVVTQTALHWARLSQSPSCSSSRIPQPFRAGTSWLCLHLPFKDCPRPLPSGLRCANTEEPLKPPPRKQQLLFLLPRSHYTELSPQLILCHLALTAEHFISQTPVLPCQHLDESVSLLNHYLIKHWWFLGSRNQYLHFGSIKDHDSTCNVFLSQVFISVPPSLRRSRCSNGDNHTHIGCV